MKLGLISGYSGRRINIPIDNVLHAESLGYESIWTSEAWGSDAVTPAAWILAQTQTIKVGTAIMQMPARTPAMAAMIPQATAATTMRAKICFCLFVSAKLHRGNTPCGCVLLSKLSAGHVNSVFLRSHRKNVDQPLAQETVHSPPANTESQFER